MDANYWQPHVSRNGRYLDVYSSLIEDGIVFVNAAIDQRIAGLIASCLIHLSAHGDHQGTARLYLNARQGDLLAALSVVDVLELFKKRKIEIQTVGIGELGPAATLILAAGTSGQRRAAANCHLSLHLTAEHIQLTNLSTDSAKSRQGSELQGRFLELLARYSGKSNELWRHYVTSEEYLSADKAIEKGLIDQTL